LVFHILRDFRGVLRRVFSRYFAKVISIYGCYNMGFEKCSDFI
jgi:hypothetical protein